MHSVWTVCLQVYKGIFVDLVSSIQECPRVGSGQVCAQPKTDPLTSGGSLEGCTTHPRTTLGRVGLVSSGQWSSRSMSDLSYNHQIFARFMLQPPNHCQIEAKTTTSSLDLSENFHLITRSNQKLPNLHRNITRSKQIQVNSAFFHGFRQTNQVHQVLEKKTRHLTCLSRFLVAKTYHQQLSVSSRPGQFGWVGWFSSSGGHP